LAKRVKLDLVHSRKLEARIGNLLEMTVIAEVWSKKPLN
jgi:hypothetical protein